MSKLALKLIAENKATRNPYLDLGNCGITELPKELGELTHLETLLLSDYYLNQNEEIQRSQNKGKSNLISDITILSSLTNLKKLYCGGGWLPDYPSNYTFWSFLFGLIKNWFRGKRKTKWQIHDISPLQYLSKLEELHLGNSQIADISSLSKLTNLYELTLSFNRITHINALSTLTNLKKLELDNNQIEDITPLGQLTQLEQLYLGGNPIKDITPLSQLTKITHLDLDDTQITDIIPLGQLRQLEQLYLGGNPIKDITPLSQLTKIMHLDLDDTQITDISPLKPLTTLETLTLSNNQITDLSPLLALYKKGCNIWIDNNPLIHPPLELINNTIDELVDNEIIKYIETHKKA